MIPPSPTPPIIVVVVIITIINNNNNNKINNPAFAFLNRTSRCPLKHRRKQLSVEVVFIL